MGAIGPGDWVEAIDTRNVPRGTVASVVRIIPRWGSCDCGREGYGLELSVPPAPGLDGWCQAHWRPIYRPNADFLESLLRKTDEPVKEPA